MTYNTIYQAPLPVVEIHIFKGDNVPPGGIVGDIWFDTLTVEYYQCVSVSPVTWVAFGGGGGSGTVTSVAASVANGLTVSGTPITTAGTLSFGLGNITPTSVAATGLISGTNFPPTFQVFSATAGQTVFNTTVNTVAKTSTQVYLLVSVNGLWMNEDATRDFTVTGANQITFNYSLSLNDLVVIYSFR